MDQTISIAIEDGEFSAYVARPPSLPAPAIVVLHEVFGVNADIRQTCGELADQGFIAVAPDLFWRQERGIDLNSWSDEEWRKGRALYIAYDRVSGVRDVFADINAATKLDGCTGKVGLMGFCLGGLMAYLTAARHDVCVIVAYRGGDTKLYLGEPANIAAPLLMHLAEEDEFISKDAQAQLKKALADRRNATLLTYPGQKHAFARHAGLHYDAGAAALANGRSVASLTEHLT